MSSLGRGRLVDAADLCWTLVASGAGVRSSGWLVAGRLFGPAVAPTWGLTCDRCCRPSPSEDLQRWEPRARAYLARRQAEGKTRRGAIRCLKRHFVRVVFRLLRQANRPNAVLVIKVRGGKVRVPALA
jgi:hypothetical protein